MNPRKIILMILMCISLIMVTINTFALDACNYEVSPNDNCEESTLVLGTCNAYNVTIYTPNHAVYRTQSLTQLASTGKYYFTFNSSNLGIHQWRACDG